MAKVDLGRQKTGDRRGVFDYTRSRRLKILTPEERKKLRRARLYGWWYLSIGAGFILLGIRFLLLGDRPVNVILRFAIAAGFFALAYYQFRYEAGSR